MANPLLERLRGIKLKSLDEKEKLVPDTIFSMITEGKIPKEHSSSRVLHDEALASIAKERKTVEATNDISELIMGLEASQVGEAFDSSATTQSTGDKFGNALAKRFFPSIELPPSADIIGGEIQRQTLLGQLEANQALRTNERTRKQTQKFQAQDLGANTLGELPLAEQVSTKKNFASQLLEKPIDPSFLAPGDEAIGRNIAAGLGLPFDPQNDTTALGPVLRGQDPLGVPTEIDPDSPLTPPIVSSLTQQRTTANQTQQSQMVPVDQARALLRTNAITSGMSKEEADALALNITEDVPISVLNKLTGEVGQGLRTTLKDTQRQAERQLFYEHQDQLVQDRGRISHDLQQEDHALTLRTKVDIAKLSHAYDVDLQKGKLSTIHAHEERRDKKKFEEKLIITGNRLADNERSRDADHINQVLRGTQQINLETLKAANRLAFEDATGDDALNRPDLLEKFYLDFMKSNPAVAGQLAELLNGEDGGEIGIANNQALRAAMIKRVQQITNSTQVEETLRTIITTEVFGENRKERMDSLDFFIDTFGKQGLDTTPMEAQLAKMEARKASGQTINVNTGKPIGTPRERDDISFLRGILSDIEFIRALHDPEETGFFDSIVGTGKSFLGIAGKRAEAFRAAVDRIQAKLVSDLAGAAIGPEEARLLLKFIPTLDSSDSRFYANMAELDRTTAELLGNRYSLLNFGARERSDELEAQGKTPAQIESRLIRERLIPPRERMP